MSQHVCPWWGGYFIDNFLRRWLHQPEVFLGPFVSPGMTILDFGCGMGFTSIAMARLLAGRGTVIAADLQPQMLRVVERRARRAGLAERIVTHQCRKDSIGLDRTIDFALAFWSAHEVPDLGKLFTEVHACLVSEGTFLVVEPRGHVTPAAMRATTEQAERGGFEALDSPPAVRWSHAAVYRRR